MRLYLLVATVRTQIYAYEGDTSTPTRLRAPRRGRPALGAAGRVKTRATTQGRRTGAVRVRVPLSTTGTTSVVAAPIEPHLYYPLAAPGLLQRGDAMTTSARTGAAGVPPSERRRNADGGLTETAAPAERGVPGARIAESARPEPETRCSGEG